jgi:hypothetical protein
MAIETRHWTTPPIRDIDVLAEKHVNANKSIKLSGPSIELANFVKPKSKKKKKKKNERIFYFYFN